VARKKTETDLEQETSVNPADSGTTEKGKTVVNDEEPPTDNKKEESITADVKYAKDQIMKVAQQKFGLNRTEAIAAFFDAPAEMTVAEAETFVKKFKERTVK
jgi:hypothetical protein